MGKSINLCIFSFLLIRCAFGVSALLFFPTKQTKNQTKNQSKNQKPHLTKNQIAHELYKKCKNRSYSSFSSCAALAVESKKSAIKSISKSKQSKNLHSSTYSSAYVQIESRRFKMFARQLSTMATIQKLTHSETQTPSAPAAATASSTAATVSAVAAASKSAREMGTESEECLRPPPDTMKPLDF